MGHQNSANASSSDDAPYRADEIAITGKDPNKAKVPAWKEYLNRMGSATMQSRTGSPWFDFGKNMTSAIADKFQK